MEIRELISKEIFLHLQNVLDALNNLEQRLLKEERGYMESGFHENHDIILTFNTKSAYSVNSAVLYPKGLEDVDCLARIEKYRTFNDIEEKLPDLVNNKNSVVNIIPGGIYIWALDVASAIPEKWLKFLKDFYRKYCNSEDDVKLIIEYVLLALKTLIRQAPKIYDVKCGSQDYLFVGYSLPEWFKVGIINLQVQIIKFDLINYFEYRAKNNLDEVFEINGVTSEKMTLIYMLNNMETQALDVSNLKGFFEKLQVNSDLLLNSLEKSYDYGFLLPKYFLPYVMPLLYRLIVDSVLKTPFLLTSTQQVNPDMEKVLKEIVNNEFETILLYLLSDPSQKPYYVNELIKKDKKNNKI